MSTIETKIPYRIPLVGGFSDFPEFYSKFGGKTIACTINKYVTVSISHNARGGIDICSKSDLPYGIGLGSSGAYHVALVAALAKFKNQSLTTLTLSKVAYDLETGIHAMATGRQDSIACLFGGFSQITYRKSGKLTVENIKVRPGIFRQLNKKLMLFDTGIRRKACDSITDIFSSSKIDVLKNLANLPALVSEALIRGNADLLGTALNHQECFRRQLSPSCRSPWTDNLLSTAREYCVGARLVGAGLGALLCYCTESRQKELRSRLKLPQIQFSILRTNAIEF